MDMKHLICIITIIVLLLPGIALPINRTNSIKEHFHEENAINDKIENDTELTSLKPAIIQLNQYRMNVTFTRSSKPGPSITGTLNLSYINSENSELNYLYFNLYPNGVQENSLVIHSVQNNQNQNLIYSIIDLIYLRVFFSNPLPINARTNLIISFTTYLPYLNDRFGFQNSSSMTGKEIYALTNWYPVVAVFENNNFTLQPFINFGESYYSDVAYYSVLIQVDKSLIVASGGYLEAYSSDNLFSYYNFSLYPAREISFVLSPDFMITKTTYNNIQIFSYYFPEDQERGSLVNSIASKSLDLFSNIFTPYPYRSMSIIDFPFSFGGMEYSGLVLISHRLYNRSLLSQSYLEVTLVHEVSHDWNTYILGNNPYRDPWLDESWAVYSEYLFFQKYDNQLRTYLISNAKDSLNQITYYGIENQYPPFNLPITLGMDYFLQDSHNLTYQTTIYTKGSLIIDLLRTYLGDDAFFKAIKEFYNEFSFKTVNTTDFINIFEVSSGLNLGWFFDEFFYNTTYIKQLFINNVNATYMISNNSIYYNFSLSQISNYLHNPIKIPISFQIDDKFVNNSFVWLNGSTMIISGSFLVDSNIENKILKINIDPENKLLRTPLTVTGSAVIKLTRDKSNNANFPITIILMTISILSFIRLKKKYK